MEQIEIALLDPSAAHELAPLIAAYAQDQRRGAPRRPDQFYAETVLADKTAEILGARVGGTLIGFAVFFDLPDMITGLRTCQVDDLFVLPDHRKSGVATKMFEALTEEGGRRGWLHLRWITDNRDDAAQRISAKHAKALPTTLYETEI